MKRNRNPILAAAVMLLWLPASALVKLPAVFGDHMVLQQKMSVQFWGWADPGEKVTIEPGWSKSAVHTQADVSGKWTVSVSTPAAGGPFDIHINDTELKDVLIGEVWICSGQSNMVFSLKGSENAKQEIAKAAFPSIRYFSVTRQYAYHTFDNSPGAVWETTTPVTAPSYSAVAYYFAKRLHQTLNVPVGIVYSAWGGTPAEAWTPEPVLKGDTVLSRYIQRWQEIQEKANVDSQSHYYYERPWREPGVLFNGMINPVIPFTVKGILWYQGESNVNYADEYYRLLSAMIRSWRTEWKKKDLPFYVVQISAFGYSSLDNAAKVREAEYEIMKKISNTATAVTADLGNMKDIHYTRKREVGDRLAYIALAREYGHKKQEYRGPEYKSASAENGKVTLTFEASASEIAAGNGQPVAAGNGMQPGASTRDGSLKGFELGYRAPSGDSLLFVPAEAKIEGDKVMVWNDQVKDPVEVRYAWLLVGEANLFNKAGLPAFPFRATVKK